MNTQCLILFAKLPIAGRCKTRLGKDLGMEEAAEFYKNCAEHLFSDLTRCPDWPSVVMHSDQNDAAAIHDWLRRCNILEVQVEAQCSDSDLGKRMYGAINSRLQQGYSKVILIGTDIPDISPHIVRQAFKTLDAHELVLGPALDGGYYLIGATRLPETIFQGITWSTAEVYMKTEHNAQTLGLQIAPVGALPHLQDIDTVLDLRTWLADAEQRDTGHPLTPAVRGLLRKME